MLEIIKIHPPVVHFGIAFPVLLLIVELYYRMNKKPLDGLHALLTYLSVIAVVLSTITGIIAHEPIEDKLHTIPVFETHEVLGLILAILFLGIGALRFLLPKREGLRNLFTLLLLIGIALLFIQGMLGGKIVYNYLLKLD